MDKKNKKILTIGAICLVVLLAFFSIIYIVTKPETSDGAKKISVQVVFSNESNKTYEINTDEIYLRDALEKENLIKGTESEYGLFITTVDGVAADDTKNEWWCITKSGEMVTTGIDTTPIADGDCFELTLSTY